MWISRLFVLLFLLVPAISRAATPDAVMERPVAQRTLPNTSPYPRPGGQRVRRAQWVIEPGTTTSHILTTLTLAAGQPLPTIRWLGREDVRRQDLHFTPQQRFYPGSQLQRAPPAPLVFTPPPGLVDRWEPLLREDFTHPLAHCRPADGSSDQAQDGWQALGNGGGQPYALIPHTGSHQQSWLVCGPFARADASQLLLQFTYRLGLDERTGARFFFGLSTDGQNFVGADVVGFTNDWLTQQVLVDGVVGEAIWLAWAFSRADASKDKAELALADLQVWRDQPPAHVCGGQTGGSKGVVLPAYDPTANPPAPMIRGGDVSAAVNLQTAGVRWVRLGIQIMGGALDLRAYDRMIDTLCAHGISVLGLLNQEMLPRNDYATPDAARFAHYRQEFITLTQFLARYFAHRIGAWEIWNEPNLGEGAYLSPPRYADLLHHSYGAIKRANPHAQVIFGGLASAWPDSHAYLAAVYAEWDGRWGGVRPFDHLGLHPYPRKQEGPNPATYLTAEADNSTIVDKFLQLMAEHGDGAKTLWITELGFNSAKRSRNRPLCLSSVLVDEAEQAAYATASLDILFNRVTLWGQPDIPGVTRIFWYQYMDVGTTDPCWPSASRNGSAHKDWWFGLYQGDKVTPKPVWCTFAAYPQPCGTTAVLYLPMIARALGS